MDNQIELNDIKGFIRRRRAIFIITFLFALLCSITIAFTLPVKYRSLAILQIEDQEIPEEYIENTLPTYVEERLKKIKRQISSFDQLSTIIKKYDLYKDNETSFSMINAVKRMEKAINLEIQSADVTNRRTGRTISMAIAFSLSYEGADPEKVKKVTDVLARLFLEEDKKIKERVTSSTISFFEDQLKELGSKISQYEKAISQFKQRHAGELPEYKKVNLDNVLRLERELDRLNSEIRSLEERKVNLSAQIATVDPYSPVIVDGENLIVSPYERLKRLHLQLVNLQSTLSDKHPDVRKLKREIRKLEEEVGTSSDEDDMAKQYFSLKGQLETLRGKYSSNHPDVVRLSKAVEALEERLKTRQAGRKDNFRVEQEPDNPTYINLTTQLNAITIKLKNLIVDREKIEREIDRHQDNIQKTPIIEQQLNAITRDYEGAKEKYDEIEDKLMKAKMAHGVVATQRGERFTILEPAELPRSPSEPNRLAIILLGFVLGCGGAFGLAATREYFDTSVKSKKELDRLTKIPVLSVISYFETKEERRNRRVKKLLWALLGVGLISAFTVTVNQYYYPSNDIYHIILKPIEDTYGFLMKNDE